MPRDIEQQTRRGRHAERATVSDLPLERHAPLPVDTFSDRYHFDGEGDSAELGCPLRDFPEDLCESFSGVHRIWEQGEIEVFGETIGFEVALLEAGTALEHPPGSRLGVVGDGGKEPTEDVVLLDDVGSKLPLLRPIEDVLLGDHPGPGRSRSGTFTHRPHRLLSRPRVDTDGSSLMMPAVRLVRQTRTTCSAPGRSISARKPRRLNAAPRPNSSTRFSNLVGFQ